MDKSIVLTIGVCLGFALGSIVCLDSAANVPRNTENHAYMVIPEHTNGLFTNDVALEAWCDANPDGVLPEGSGAVGNDGNVYYYATCAQAIGMGVIYGDYGDD